MDKLNLYSVSSIAVMISCFSMAILVLWKGKKRSQDLLWSLMCFSAGIWGLGGYNVSIQTSKQQALFWWQVASTGIILTPVFYIHFIYEFLYSRKKSFLVLLYCFGVMILLINIFFREYYVGNLRFVFNEFYWLDMRGENTISLLFYGIFFWALMPCVFITLVRHFRKTEGLRRQQVKYLILGTGIGWIGAELQTLPKFGVDLYPVSNFLIAVYPLIITYAIIRFKFMNINIILRKGLVYSVLVTIITAAYLIFVTTLGRIFQGIFGEQSFITNLIAVFIIAILFNPLRDWIQHVLDKMFFQGTLESLAQEKQRLQQELFHKEKLAYVGQLASSVVHEIRNPLTAIKAYIDHLPRKYGDPEFKAKFHALVPREVERIEKVVTNLLNLAKPSRPNLRTLNICSLADSTLTLLENHLTLKKINVERCYGDEEIEIQADEEQLKQVFLNLFLNSIQAMEKGGELMIRTEYSVPGTAKKTKDVTPYPVPRTQYPKFGIQNPVRIIIKDTGIGMSEETIKNLFTPFYTTKKDGSGLGMVITQEIIKEHGGNLSVESEVGKGTTFTVELPIDKEH